MLRIIGLFLVAAVNLVLWYWTTTPYYAVMEIREALKTHDLERFERYVDVESMATRMIDGLFYLDVRRALGHGVMGRLVGSGFVNLVKPQLVELIREQVQNFVTRNEMSAGRLEDQYLDAKN